MSLANSSTYEAMLIFGELVECICNRNPHGGNSAEIYAHRLLPHSPTGAVEGFYTDQCESAARAMTEILEVFSAKYSDNIKIHIDGSLWEPGDDVRPNGHRWNISINP